MAPRKKKQGQALVIVESPAKAKTIEKYLGTGFEVMASMGHVRDLVKRHKKHSLGIDIEGGWIPFYKVSDEIEKNDRRKANFDALKKKAAKSDTVYLAPDPDREGEAIAWHLKESLGLKDEQIQRVTFNEITKRAIQEAFQHPGGINMDLVNAQEARRFLDRVVGFPLSRLLRQRLSAAAKSAGRVQSVAVRMIVEREREIEAFKPEEYWKVTSLLAPEGTVAKPQESILARAKAQKTRKKNQEPKNQEAADGEAPPEPPVQIPEGSYLAELAEWQGKKFAAANAEAAGAVVKALEGATYVVSRIEQKDRPERPQPPFTTSTLQQQGSIRLRFSTKQTMQLAQRLYEGVTLGDEGLVALITYMRTDSTRISADALQACRNHIQAEYGPKYLPDKANSYASGKGAQEAHEAIRPTSLDYTPDRVQPYLPKQQYDLYKLIYNRFVASQMTPAIFSVTNVDVAAADGVFKAQGKVLKFDGYRRVLPPGGKQEDALLPDLKEKQRQDLLDLHASQHFTQPPPRYNEASLVKAMEKEGIGRPSTYAAIISKIQDVGYVEQRERRFYATELGKSATDMLVKYFPKILDLKFTGHMEEELDDIASRKMQRNAVLDEFWGAFQKDYEVAEKEMKGEKQTGEACPQCGKPLEFRFSRKTKKQFVGCSGYPECTYIKPGEGEEARPAAVETEYKCPTCGKPMLQRMGARGAFLGCSGYPECKTTMNFDAEGKPVLSSQPTEHKCNKCGAPMVLREGKRGPFLGCSAYPKCRNIMDVDAQGNPVKPVDTGVACDKCGGPMVVKKSFRGPFLSCAAYPKCKNAKPLPAELKEKLKDQLPAPAKKEGPKIEVSETCPECGAAMKLRSGRGGTYFLGCTKYPKCRGTRELSPELMEKVAETV